MTVTCLNTFIYNEQQTSFYNKGSFSDPSYVVIRLTVGSGVSSKQRMFRSGQWMSRFVRHTALHVNILIRFAL